MKVRLRYRIVLEGTYEVDPLQCAYDTTNANEIADQERDWATESPIDWLIDGVGFGITENDLDVVTEVLILPV